MISKTFATRFLSYLPDDIKQRVRKVAQLGGMAYVRWDWHSSDLTNIPYGDPAKVAAEEFEQLVRTK